jgi:hypothetical protein
VHIHVYSAAGGESRQQAEREGEDSYAERHKAGPVSARVLPHARLAQLQEDLVRLLPEARACAAAKR